VSVLVRVVAGLLALAACAGLIALSGLTSTVTESPEGLVRLSWRAVGERVEACRVPSDEELAALPPHMRQAEICEGHLAPFALAVSLDAERIVEREVRPAGAREDRPTYVFQELPVAPGPHRLDVSFAVVEGDAAASVPPLRLHATIDVPPRGVVLVTRDDQSGELVVRQR